jgi:hypothetical protein
MSYDSREVLRMNSPEHLGARRLTVVATANQNIDYVIDHMPVPTQQRELKVPVSAEVRRYQEEREYMERLAEDVKDMTIERLSQEAALLAEGNQINVS